VGRPRAWLVWALLAGIVVLAFVEAALSPQLQWRRAVYIAAGFAGVLALALVLFQPLLAAGRLPGLPLHRARRLHRLAGAALVAAVAAHVVGLWLTSPPDVIDALLFESPTPFSVWGVLAMGAVAGSAALALLRRPLRLPVAVWRVGHTLLALVIVAGSILHAMLVEGTMGVLSKSALCLLAAGATVLAIRDLRVWSSLARRRS
jgi:hypothetical protein